MKKPMLGSGSFLLLLVAIVLAVACAPAAAPTPTAAPTKAAAPAPAPPTPTAAAPAKPTATAAPAAKPFYEGKTLTWLVGDMAGGGPDTYARSVAPYLPKHIPGNPKIVIQNMPGASGALALNEMYNNVKPDGLTFSITPAGYNVTYLLRPQWDARKHDLKDMPVVASTGNYTEQVFAPSVSGIKTARDFLNRGSPVRVCGIVPGTQFTAPPAILFDALSVAFKPVFGYKSPPEANLAMERNECDLSMEDLAGYYANGKARVEKGDYQILFQSGTMDKDGKLDKHPAYPGIPTLTEVYEQLKGQPMPAKHLAAWKALLAANVAGKLMLVPPRTPQEPLDTLRNAFLKLRDDAEYQAAYEKQNKVKDPLLVGTEVEPAVKRLLDTPKDTVDFIRNLEGIKD